MNLAQRKESVCTVIKRIRHTNWCFSFSFNIRDVVYRKVPRTAAWKNHSDSRSIVIIDVRFCLGRCF